MVENESLACLCPPEDTVKVGLLQIVLFIEAFTTAHIDFICL
jgi:hypothetical protein